MVNVVIIGSGPTALGAAIRLHELQKTDNLDINVTILEKETIVGGLAGSITDKRGFTWDLGVHVTGSSKYAGFMKIINEAVEGWNQVPRYVKAYMGHILKNSSMEKNYVPYPVQESVAYFPEKEKQKCLEDFEGFDEEQDACSFDSFAAFSKKYFGLTLYSLFIQPYNEKVWTVDLKTLNCAWVAGRVPRTDFKATQSMCALSEEELWDLEEQKKRVSFRYPAFLKGIGLMWQAVAALLPAGWVNLKKNVMRINIDQKKVFCDDGSSYKYDYVISTMPITQLGKITKLAPDIQLKHSKVFLVGLGIRRPQPEWLEKMSWIYFPQPELVFYRCTFISNFNDYMTPNAAVFWSLICEIAVSSEDRINAPDMIQQTINGLTSSGILPSDAQIVSKWSFVLPFGYPIPTRNRDEELRKWQPVFEAHSIYSRGRFGSWKYEAANQDHSYTIGEQVIDRLFAHGDEHLHSV